MIAILYRVDGEDRLVVAKRDPEIVDHRIVTATEIDHHPGDVFELVTDVGAAPDPTLEAVTDAIDPWLAWYGGTDDGPYAVLYGPRDGEDRKVSFEERSDKYRVSLEFGTVEDVPENEFEPDDCTPVVVESGSKTYAKRVFYDFCDVE